MNVKVLIAEDHEIFREGVRKLIETFENVEKVYEARNGEECLKLVEEIKPDVIFMDIKMPVLNGIECTRIISQKYPDIKIIALTMYNEEEYIQDMLEAGAKGFLLKTCSITEIKNSINTVLQGKNFFSSEIVQVLANLYLKEKGYKEKKEKVEFSNREKEVLKYLCKGYTSQEIGKILNISHRTVEVHKYSMMEKIGAKNAIQLLVYALKNGYVNLDNNDNVSIS